MLVAGCHILKHILSRLFAVHDKLTAAQGDAESIPITKPL
jgi:hypothetical protein